MPYLRRVPGLQHCQRMESFRLVTIHPALVHMTIGALPFLTLAYGMAMRRKSERWTFAADALLIFTAIATLAVALFGLLAFLDLAWPDGLDFWRWLHLGLGVTSTVLIVGFGIARALARRRGATVAHRGTFGMSLFLLALVGATGWVGGEVLVYHAGMAVKAAANGALAPPTGTRDEPPGSLEDAMGHIRGHWASATTNRASMLVERPSPGAFARIAADAAEIQELAEWVAREGAARYLRRQGPAGTGSGAGYDAEPPHGVEQLAARARMLEARATELARAARAQDLRGVVEATAAMETVCTGCHIEFRWARRPALVPAAAHGRAEAHGTPEAFMSPFDCMTHAACMSLLYPFW